ncbi:MAG: RNA polymerase sigma factor [Bacteroides sp.]|nr:RNA polymerase sigma factor [Bacteroides sp.]
MTPQSFRAKLVEIQDNLYSFAYMLTSNRADAEDLLQDTTLKILDNEDKYLDNVNFRGWVFTIMRNTFINGYRKAVRNPTTNDTSDDLYLLSLPRGVSAETPEDAVGAVEIERIMASLPDDLRIPFSMHVAGYKYIEIAQTTGTPIGTVKSRIYFARRRLQALLKDYR